MLSRSFSVHARESALRGIRAYSRFKFEYYPEDPMAFVAELSDNDRQKLKDCLDRYAIEMEEEHIEKPSNRKLRLGKSIHDNVIIDTIYSEGNPRTYNRFSPRSRITISQGKICRVSRNSSVIG